MLQHKLEPNARVPPDDIALVLTDDLSNRTACVVIKTQVTPNTVTVVLISMKKMVEPTCVISVIIIPANRLLLTIEVE